METSGGGMWVSLVWFRGPVDPGNSSPRKEGITNNALKLARLIGAQKLEPDYMLVSSVPSAVSDFLWPYGLWSARLLCPRDSPGKNTGSGFPHPPPGESSLTRDRTHVCCIYCIAGRFFPAEPLGKSQNQTTWFKFWLCCLMSLGLNFSSCLHGDCQTFQGCYLD